LRISERGSFKAASLAITFITEGSRSTELEFCPTRLVVRESTARAPA
jgi:hypothetical protein